MGIISLPRINSHGPNNPLVEPLLAAELRSEGAPRALQRDPRTDGVRRIRQACVCRELVSRQRAELGEVRLQIRGAQRLRDAHMEEGVLQRDLKQKARVDGRVEVRVQQRALGHLWPHLSSIPLCGKRRRRPCSGSRRRASAG